MWWKLSGHTLESVHCVSFTIWIIFMHISSQRNKRFVYFCLFTSFFHNQQNMHFNIKIIFKKKKNTCHYHVEQNLSFPTVYDTVTLLLKIVVKKSFSHHTPFFWCSVWENPARATKHAERELRASRVNMCVTVWHRCYWCRHIYMQVTQTERY